MTRPTPPLLFLLAAASWSFAAPPDWDRVRDPESLRDTRTPQSLAELRSLFADPPAEYRSAPLWVWNDELEWPRLEAQLRQFADRGMGGVFVHPRPGLITEYLGEEWFDLWRRSIALGKELGLKVHIYDEDSYPAGFAGGHVPSRAPDTFGRVLTYEWRDSTRGLPWSDPSVVGVFSVERGEDRQPTGFARLAPGDGPPEGDPAFVAVIEPVDPRPFTAGFPYVDLTNPRTTELFLETTYERYWKEIGDEFGRSVIWAFSDEPGLSRKPGWDGPGLPLSLRALAEFRRRRGYDLADHIPSLYWDVGDFRRVRFDYWELMHTLLTEAFFEPMFDWCDRHGLQWTGHWWEHLWPYPWSTPSDMSFYAFEHTPGIDLLMFGSRGLLARGVEPHMLLTVKQVSSAAHQLGRPRVLSETYGGGGWRATLEDFKRMGDWEIVHGVNLVNQHLSYVTTRGPRKRDWPQSFGDVAEWWGDYGPHARHLGRLSLAMASGVAAPRVLVLNPTTTAFTLARRAQPNGGNPDLEQIKSDHDALVQDLADHQVDFDLGDEYLLERLGGVEGDRLRVGRIAYDVVVWPRHMDNVRERTLELLSSFAGSGGSIVALGGPASYVDGRWSDAALDLTDRWTRVTSHDQLLAAVRRHAPPRVTFADPLPPGVGFAERVLDGGDRVLLFNNAGPERVETTAEIEGGLLEVWDTLSGEVRPLLASGYRDGRVRFPLSLPPAGSLLLTARKDAAPALGEAPEVSEGRALEASEWTVEAGSPNVLVLDFCDVSVNGRTLEDALVMTASRAVFREHGFATDPWESTVQFETATLDRNTFGEDTGFEATFRFHVAQAEAIRGLELAVEAPELYEVAVNGQRIDFSGAERWLDPHLLRTPIADAARPGENRVVITGRPFDVRMAVEPVYLLGDFAVRPVLKGFEIASPKGLGFGPWAEQGRPFDGASVRYSTEVDLPEGTSALRIELGRWNGSLAEVLVDGERAALLGWPPWHAEVPTAAGRHRVTVRVAGTPRNVFGPFHDPRPVPRVLWPGSWTLFAGDTQPAGSDYEPVDYGLLEPPRLSALVAE
jgi:hypothetical protein